MPEPIEQFTSDRSTAFLLNTNMDDSTLKQALENKFVEVMAMTDVAWSGNVMEEVRDGTIESYY